MWKYRGYTWIILLLLLSCQMDSTEKQKGNSSESIMPKIDLAEADRLAALPLKCINQQYPYKLGQTLGGPEDLATPLELHPAFYGCFDWHSAVHAHWSVVVLLKMFPELSHGELAKRKLHENLSAENIRQEVKYFEGPHNKTFERTYGWAWLLKLAEELHTWEDPLAGELESNLKPLTDLIVRKYLDFLPKLVYPIRSGTHPNTAFGLAFAYDYAETLGEDSLKNLIVRRSRDYFLNDSECPLAWEPSGSDFISPCFQEADIMRRVLPSAEFKIWLASFLPSLFEKDFHLEPAIVSDRQDGQLVHLDGLNFNRAWCAYGLAQSLPDLGHLNQVADEHINYSLGYVTDGNYEGGHWLATFAIMALKGRERISQSKSDSVL